MLRVQDQAEEGPRWGSCASWDFPSVVVEEVQGRTPSPPFSTPNLDKVYSDGSLLGPRLCQLPSPGSSHLTARDDLLEAAPQSPLSLKLQAEETLCHLSWML